MAFRIILTDRAKKDLAKLERHIAKRITEKLEAANSGGFLFLEKVKGQGFYKYRVGKFRIFMEKHAGERTLQILFIMPRKKAYKGL